MINVTLIFGPLQRYTAVVHMLSLHTWSGSSETASSSFSALSLLLPLFRVKKEEGEEKWPWAEHDELLLDEEEVGAAAGMFMDEEKKRGHDGCTYYTSPGMVVAVVVLSL